MTNQEQHIQDTTNNYFHIMPNMADDDLDPYQYRLYGHYKRVCGDNGTCWQSTKTTATITKMSVGKVASTRRELVELGYIHINEDGHTLQIKMCDVMPKNTERYRKRSPHERERSPHEPKKNKEEEHKEKDKTLSVPLSVESVTDVSPSVVENKETAQNSDYIQFIITTTEQLSKLTLTAAQRTMLTEWLVSHYSNTEEYGDYTGKRKQVMKNLVKQGYLSTNFHDAYSTTLQSTKPKSILFSLTYAQLDEKPDTAKGETDKTKPFWDLVAAMYCWNDNNMKWTVYSKLASPKEIAALAKKIKTTCLALDAWHLDNPFTVAEFKWIVNFWYIHKFKGTKDEDKRFPVSQEAIENNMASLRVAYKLYLSNKSKGS